MCKCVRFGTALLFVGLGIVSGTDVSHGQDTPDAASLSTRWMVVCCGLPGDDEHRQRLTKALQQLISAAEPVFGVAAERLTVLAGDELMTEELQTPGAIELCTKASLQSTLDELSEMMQPDDSFWLFALGHADWYGQRSRFNISGPDVDQHEFAEWTKSIPCREQVYWLATPVSGFWLKPLSGDGRIVLSATEADLEFTGTELPYALGDVVAGTAEYQAFEDIDTDGAITLLDLYLATCIEVVERFRAIERLQTEHAQLDDNGDGRGSEVQEPYLPPEPEDASDPDADEDAEPPEPAKSDVRPAPEPIVNQNLDGFRTRQISLKPPAVSESNGT